MPAALAAVFDAVCVLAFAVLGRRSHDEGAGLSATLGVALPFLLALAAGWGISRAWRRPLATVTGLILWVVTVAGGMALRHWAFSRGTAVAFVVVATAFFALTLLGWRAVARLVLARRGAAVVR